MADLACRPGAAGPFVPRSISEGNPQTRSASEGQARSTDKRFPSLARRACGLRRRGFTLLELLIAMALTLLLVYALAEFYAYVGDTVRDGRALIEMSGDLRSAVQQLRDDLNSLTVRPSPPVDEGKGAGHLEAVEGVASDIDADGNGTYDATIATTQSDGSTRFDGLMFGDMDDILSMTIRSSGSPFVGRRYNPNFNTGIPVSPTNQPYQTVESSLAEVVWFTTFNDRNGDFDWDGDEERFLVRRVLLIRPDLPIGLPPPASMAGGETVFQHNDISAHWDGTNWIANSLDDLSRRENRFIHINFRFPDLNLLNNTPLNRPWQVQLDPGRALNATNYPNNDPDGRNVTYYELRSTAFGDFRGEDRILPNVLAFDVRVFDPTAPLRGDNTDLIGDGNDTSTPTDDILLTLQPGEPGYLGAIVRGHPIVGFGAYVDMWYNRSLILDPYTGVPNHPQGLYNTGVPIANWPNSAFAWAPDVHGLPPAFHPAPGFSNGFRDPSGRHLAVCFDTWSTYYERDGRNQDGDTDAMGNPLIDEGTNGIDDDGVNGVDDPEEREMHPPYPADAHHNGVDDNLDGTVDDNNEPEGPARSPLLRGIQVRIRMYEPGTRQTRQSTVVADFVSE